MPQNILYFAGAYETEGTFRWVSHENTSFFSNHTCSDFCSWISGEPNQLSGEEHCMTFGVGWRNTTWNDVVCDGGGPSFIIEYDCGCINGQCLANSTCKCYDGFSGELCQDNQPTSTPTPAPSCACNVSELCCNKTTCQFLPKGYVCHPSSSGYKKTEVGNKKTEQCPPRSFFATLPLMVMS
eukprot:Phypoly_transcript_09723.p2 GENE.Phypoly_transcript_09723~~Phypoly_transcript_09723.p2  ORF type:complete len:182 (+),score=18.56 Phypoly_transcript_09723:113-658(+)